jgi:hypothetical protein
MNIKQDNQHSPPIIKFIDIECTLPLIWQTVVLSLQNPVAWHVTVTFPTTLYPLLHEYVPFDLNNVLFHVTLPFAGDVKFPQSNDSEMWHITKL